MSRCLRCSKPCDAAAVFCDECRSELRTTFRQEGDIHALHAANTPNMPNTPNTLNMSPGVQSGSGVSAAIKEAGSSQKAPNTPHPPVLETFHDSATQVISGLNEAAQRIAGAEPVYPSSSLNRRLPRASRLTSFRDISSEIRRESTPLPRLITPHPDQIHTNGEASVIEQKGRSGGEVAAQEGEAQESQETQWPDLWPWFDNEPEEKEDIWAGRTDPLVTRHKPTSSEAARIEEEDMKRAWAEGVQTSQIPIRVVPRRKPLLRIIFVTLAVFAVIALAVDGILLSAVYVHPHSSTAATSGPSTPPLTLSANQLEYEKLPQAVQLHITHFQSNTNVSLTRDWGIPIVPGSSSTAQIGSNGSTTVTILVTKDWSPGFHSIYAEDITTRYTASATLQITSTSQLKPPSLVLSVLSLDFGTEYEGVDSFRPLTLSNGSPSGSISWSASSNKSWLLITPNQGTFNQYQTVDVAVQRDGKLPTSNTGTITFYSNVGSTETLTVTMGVKSLPSNVGAVLALSPAALSFTTVDGASASPPQSLTINNPGLQPLEWSISVIAPATSSAQIAMPALSAQSGWLLVSQASGEVLAQSSTTVTVSVNSASLLPGTYLGSLVFIAQGALDVSQTVSVSLTVQQHCGLVTSTGFLPFTLVAGNSGNQTLSVNATASCAGAPISWASQVSSAGWLTLAPGSGKLQGTTSQYLSVSVNTSGLAPRTYYGNIVLTAQNSTQTIIVQLIVQAPPPPSAPIMGASPLNLNFSNTEGQPNPKGQVVTITNNGGSPLNWKTTEVFSGSNCWLCVSPTGGTVQKGQTESMIVNVDTTTTKLTPGTYAAQITLTGTDSNNNAASGSGQVVSINLVVQPPCTLTQPSSSSLAFSGVQGGANPIAQTVLITGAGNCSWPLQLTTNVPSSTSWLSVQTSSSSINGNGQSASFAIGPNSTFSTLKPGTYTSQVTIAATDSAGVVAQGSPQVISVTLTVQPPPCVVGSPAPASLTFSIVQGLTSTTAQNVALSASSTCTWPLTYTATVSSTAPWLTLTPPVPDTGAGSTLGVNVNALALTAGTYTGKITITAKDGNGVAATGSQTISVTVTVVLATISGSVSGCTSGVPPSCTTTTPLPGATVTVLNGAGATVATATADASGNYSVNLPASSYTVNVSGTDSGGILYAGTAIPLVVTASATANFQISPAG